MAGISQPGLLEQMVTQDGDIAVNNTFTTGTSTLPIAIDRTRPYFWSVTGQRGGTNAVDQRHTVALTADNELTATRNGSAGNATVSYTVTGVRK